MALSDAILRLIRGGARNNATAIVDGVKHDAKRPAWVTDEPQAYFQGRHLGRFSAFLARAYPRATLNEEILAVAPNYFRTWAETEADIYRTGEPQRLGATDAATARIAALCQAAKTRVHLPEMETRSIAGGVQFARIIRNPLTDRLEISRHWWHDVWIVADPRAPSSIEHARAALIRLGPQLHELWYRVEGDAWRADQIDTSADRPRVTPILTEPYAGRLPIVAMYSSLPETGFYPADNADAVRAANNHMLLWTELVHVARLQGHNPIWFSGSEDALRPEAGPAGINYLGVDGTMGALQVNPKLDELQSLVEAFAGATARSRGQSPRAYVTRPVPLNSGVALRVDNQIAEEKRPQRIGIMADFEREHLLPILDEVERLITPRNPRNKLPNAAIDWAAVEIVFPPPPTIEDPSQRNQRMAHAQRSGWITPARAAVEAGYYDTEAQAIAAGVGAELADPFAGDDPAPAEPGERGPAPAIPEPDADG